MPTLLVQDFLRNGNSLEDLYRQHAVKASAPTNNKMSFNYDQIEAKDDDPVAQQCRALILRPGSWEVVSRSFDRFFNHGQEAAVNVDWHTANFEDKKDGSLCPIFFDKEINRWMCATRSMPEAQGYVGDTGFQFSQLVEMAVKKNGYKSLHDWMSCYPSEWRNYTFIFELTSPYNRIVCDYKEIELTLLGVRNNYTFEEYHPEDFHESLNVDIPHKYDFNNINDLIEAVKSWDPIEKEGVVVKDASFNRIKIKNPSYVAYNRISQSLVTSWRGCIEVILLGTDDDIIPMMPEVIANRLRRLKPLIAEVLRKTQADYDRLKHIENKKEFALEAQKTLWQHALFALKNNKVPDLMSFARGEMKPRQGPSIPKPALDTMLSLCEKLDPEIKSIEEDISIKE